VLAKIPRALELRKKEASFTEFGLLKTEFGPDISAEGQTGGMFNNTQRGANMPKTVFPMYRVPGVTTASGEGRSTLYSRISQGLWTKPVRLGPRSVGWPEYEVEALIAARIAGKSDEEIRALVLELEAARKDVGSGRDDEPALGSFSAAPKPTTGNRLSSIAANRRRSKRKAADPPDLLRKKNPAGGRVSKAIAAPSRCKSDRVAGPGESKVLPPDQR
jgi:prophage regulatory protein